MPLGSGFSAVSVVGERAGSISVVLPIRLMPRDCSHIVKLKIGRLAERNVLKEDNVAGKWPRQPHVEAVCHEFVAGGAIDE